MRVGQYNLILLQAWLLVQCVTTPLNYTFIFSHYSLAIAFTHVSVVDLVYAHFIVPYPNVSIKGRNIGEFTLYFRLPIVIISGILNSSFLLD